VTEPLPADEAPRRWGEASALFDEEEARRRLLAATERCIIRKGSVQIQVGDVANEAGVSRSTVYRYFQSRDELIRALLLLRTDAAFGRLVSTLADPDDARSTLPQLVLGPVGLVKGNPLNEALYHPDSRALMMKAFGLSVDPSADVAFKHFGPLFEQWQITGQICGNLDIRQTVSWVTSMSSTLLTPPWDVMTTDERRTFVDAYLVRALLTR
jgi:TetR/AcrR family transcriptional regulator